MNGRAVLLVMAHILGMCIGVVIGAVIGVLIVWLVTLIFPPAHAGDNAPLSALVIEEWRVSVFEVTCTDLGDCCGVYRDCGDWYQRPHDPAPVPLPWTILLLTAAIAALVLKGLRL